MHAKCVGEVLLLVVYCYWLYICACKVWAEKTHTKKRKQKKTEERQTAAPPPAVTGDQCQKPKLPPQLPSRDSQRLLPPVFPSYGQWRTNIRNRCETSPSVRMFYLMGWTSPITSSANSVLLWPSPDGNTSITEFILSNIFCDNSLVSLGVFVVFLFCCCCCHFFAFWKLYFKETITLVGFLVQSHPSLAFLQLQKKLSICSCGDERRYTSQWTVNTEVGTEMWALRCGHWDVGTEVHTEISALRSALRCRHWDVGIEVHTEMSALRCQH